jgi:hypothetical protein
MSRDMEMQPANTGRLWTIVDKAIRPTERKKTAGVMGALITAENPTRAFLDKATSPDRDMLLITPERLVVIRPRAVANLGFRDALRVKKGDLSTVLNPEVSVPRQDVRDIVVTQETPPGFRIIQEGIGDAALTFVRADFIHGGEETRLDFWVDTGVGGETPDRVNNFVGTVDIWFGRKPISA